MKVATVKYPHYIDIDTHKYSRKTRMEMWQWCRKSLGDVNNHTWSWDNGDEYLGTFKFTELQYAQWFLLRWGTEG